MTGVRTPRVYRTCCTTGGRRMLHTARRVSIFSKLMTSRSRILHAVHSTVHRQPLPGPALQSSAATCTILPADLALLCLVELMQLLRPRLVIRFHMLAPAPSPDVAGVSPSPGADVAGCFMLRFHRLLQPRTYDLSMPQAGFGASGIGESGIRRKRDSAQLGFAVSGIRRKRDSAQAGFGASGIRRKRDTPQPE